MRMKMLLLLCSLLTTLNLLADTKLISLDGFPIRHWIDVAPTGDMVYLSGSDYLMIDTQGKLVKKVAFSPWGTAPMAFCPIDDGWFIAGVRGLSGRIDLHRPDGSVAKTLVQVGGGEKVPHNDPNWANPDGLTVDLPNKRIFLLDSTEPGREPSPDWSRIIVYDFDGKYINDVARYDATAADATEKDDLRTTYTSIAVDPTRKIIYLAAWRQREIRAYSYDGKFLRSLKAFGSLAVLADGRLAVAEGRGINLYTPELTLESTLKYPDEASPSVKDLATDARGNLYAVMNDNKIVYIRWSNNLQQVDIFKTSYLQIDVNYPNKIIAAGTPFNITVNAAGNPTPAKLSWQVLARPADGSDLRWRKLPASIANGELTVATPAEMDGFYEIAVRYGDGPIGWANRENDPSIQRTMAFLPQNATQSLTVLSASGRSAFQQGEAISLQIIARQPQTKELTINLLLEQEGTALSNSTLTLSNNLSLQIPALVTRRLPPGHYLVRPILEGYHSYAFPLDIAVNQPDSPMQRILYSEFGGGGSTIANELADNAERMASVRDYARAMAHLEFSRETERTTASARNDGPRAWQHSWSPVALTDPGFAPVEYYKLPYEQGWGQEYYFDQAVKYGINLDSQLLGHCDGTPICEASLNRDSAALQRYAQWMGKYPSFYGFNYNDEMFIRSYGWNPDEEEALKKLITDKFAAQPLADAYNYATGQLYDRYNNAVRQVMPNANITTTPMWQFPAVEGSYVPTIFRGMTETYGHYMTEGQHVPWYPAHNTEFFRRPGLAAMGTNDNGHNGAGGDIYLKNTMQVLTLGVQGVGIGLTNAMGGAGRGYGDPEGADAYRTANLLAKMYGAIYAEASPIKEAAVLYSYAQDITEKRSTLGTPHWERVYSMLGAGLMAGLPMHIIYQEDIANGYLLNNKKARYPMLFLVGQKEPLPPEVQSAMAKYQQAGGKLFTDNASADYPLATRLDLETLAVKDVLHANLNKDSMWPETAPIFEKLAADLQRLVGQFRSYPIDGDEPWTAKTAFDGGEIKYISVASETSPYPWDAGTTWSLGASYMRSYFPRTVTLSFPITKGVIYDVFDQQLQTPKINNNRTIIKADLTTFPGRLFAVLPVAIAAPRVTASALDGVVNYTITAFGANNKVIKAQVPMRIRLLDGKKEIYRFFRGTGKDGLLKGNINLPFGKTKWTFEVTELLSGKGNSTQLAADIALPPAFIPRENVDILREKQLRLLLQQAKAATEITLAIANDKILTPEQLASLTTALKQQGITLKQGAIDAKNPSTGIYLAAGYVSGKNLGTLISAGQTRGLCDYNITENIPGAGHALITSLFSIRGYGENAIALIAGDEKGLQQAVSSFINWLANTVPALNKTTPGRSLASSGTATSTPSVPLLREMTGVKLTGVRTSADKQRLLITADGYLNNVALLQDKGNSAQLLQAVRIGQGTKVESEYLSADGKLFGVSSRVTDKIGEGFQLINTTGGATQIFASFGDYAPRTHHFAASDNGNTVIAPGQYGVVCWQRTANGWQEAWAIDYWQEFQQLDWPLNEKDERLPAFNAYIPKGADYAIIVFAETTNNGWVVAENHYRAWVTARDLATGKERWKFDIPIADTLLFPLLHSSPNGRQNMLQVQKDSFGKETFSYFTIDENGKILGNWNAKVAPRSVALADATGKVAEAFKDRLLEVRNADGSLIYNQLWDGADIISITFAGDGNSLYVADAADILTLLNSDGSKRWSTTIGSVSYLASGDKRIYAAGWDGRLRAYTEEGELAWTFDCTPAMKVTDPKAMLLAMPKLLPDAIHQPQRPSLTNNTVPAGENLLRSGAATLKTGGTPGWLSAGINNVDATLLTNGTFDDVTSPWLPLSDCYMDAATGRQVWAEIIFKVPTDISSLTVYENKNHPEAWPSEGLVQVWNEPLQRWDTALRAIYLQGPITTYPLKLTGVKKLRYAPWNGYYRNFYTSEIEVR